MPAEHVYMLLFFYKMIQSSSSSYGHNACTQHHACALFSYNACSLLHEFERVQILKKTFYKRNSKLVPLSILGL